MVSKNYIPINEKSFRAREKATQIESDPELQKALIRVSAKLGGCFNQTIIEELRGKDLFQFFMKASPEELNDIPGNVWGKIEDIVRTTPNKIQKQWLDEAGIPHKDSPL